VFLLLDLVLIVEVAIYMFGQFQLLQSRPYFNFNFLGLYNSRSEDVLEFLRQEIYISWVEKPPQKNNHPIIQQGKL